LLLSLALVALIPYWAQEREETALGRYIALRLNLATSINQLGDDPQWQQYKAAHEAAESTPIEQLLKVLVETPSSDAHAKKEQLTPPTTVENETKQNATLVPPPPSNIRISTQIDTIHEIVSSLRGLYDSGLLTNSRKVSGFYDYSIYLWDLKRHRLANRNMLSGTVVLSGADEKEFRHDKDGLLLKYLTLRDVRELAQFELPKIPDSTRPGGRYGKEIDIAPGSLPRNLYMAAVFAEVLLLFIVMYFYAFTREAVSSPTFPAPGTLFSAFSRSSWTLAVFFIALWSPVAASLGVAVASRKLPLIVCSVLIGCAVLSVHITFRRKSYF